MRAPMLTVDSYGLAVALCVVTMICWGSWANTQKAVGKWRFELFYYDFSVGLALCMVVAAFTFGSMGELLDSYVRLKEQEIRPFFCVNHGPTTSMYYADPDGNRVELQIDNFATAEEGQAWMLSPAFARNPIGVEYDPDALVARFRSGVPVAELVVRD